MKQLHDKVFTKSFLGIFKIHIYSEDRYSDQIEQYWNTLYKHFVSIYLFKWKVFSTHWMTGSYSNGNTQMGGFYEKEN